MLAVPTQQKQTDPHCGWTKSISHYLRNLVSDDFPEPVVPTNVMVSSMVSFRLEKLFSQPSTVAFLLHNCSLKSSPCNIAEALELCPLIFLKRPWFS